MIISSQRRNKMPALTWILTRSRYIYGTATDKTGHRLANGRECTSLHDRINTLVVAVCGTQFIEVLCYKPEVRLLSTSDRTMALGSSQPLTEMSTRDISCKVKAAGAYGWLPYQLHVPTALKSGSLNLQEPLGPVQACTWIALNLLFMMMDYRVRTPSASGVYLGDDASFLEC